MQHTIGNTEHMFVIDNSIIDTEDIGHCILYSTKPPLLLQFNEDSLPAWL